MTHRRLTTDEIRSLQKEINNLCYDIEKFKESSEREDNRAYNSHLRTILTECISDTINNLYSIVKDTQQGVTGYGPL